MGGAKKSSKKPEQLKESLGSAKAMPSNVKSSMEGSFRTDLSGVNLYESPLVKQGGADAVTSGKDVAFAPGKLNFGSHSGRELLGHELSHVVSQGKGEVSGKGVVNNHALESKADAEGAKAAANFGKSGGLSPMSKGMGSLASSGPIQCQKSSTPELTKSQKMEQYFGNLLEQGDYAQVVDLAHRQQMRAGTRDERDGDESKSMDAVMRTMVLPQFRDGVADTMTGYMRDNAAQQQVNRAEKLEQLTAGTKDRRNMNADFYQQNSPEMYDYSAMTMLMQTIGSRTGRNGHRFTDAYTKSQRAANQADPMNVVNQTQVGNVLTHDTDKALDGGSMRNRAEGYMMDGNVARAKNWVAPWEVEEKKKKHRFRRWLN